MLISRTHVGDEIYLISIENKGDVRFTKIMKFNTKVLNFDVFANLEDLFRIET